MTHLSKKKASPFERRLQLAFAAEISAAATYAASKNQERLVRCRIRRH
jgi:hypothetical protein